MQTFNLVFFLDRKINRDENFSSIPHIVQCNLYANNLQARDGRDGYRRLQIHGAFSSTSDSGSLSGASYSTDPTERSAQEAS